MRQAGYIRLHNRQLLSLNQLQTTQVVINQIATFVCQENKIYRNQPRTDKFLVIYKRLLEVVFAIVSFVSSCRHRQEILDLVFFLYTCFSRCGSKDCLFNFAHPFFRESFYISFFFNLTIYSAAFSSASIAASLTAFILHWKFQTASKAMKIKL